MAIRLNGQGGGETVDLSEIKEMNNDLQPYWVHLDYQQEEAVEWLYEKSGIDDVIVEAMVTKETRPRSLVHGSGIMLILRGINLNPENEPEDMVSIRMWIEAGRAITMSHRKVMAVEDIRKAIMSGSGPSDSSNFIEDISDRLVVRVGTVISGIEDSADELENLVLTEQSIELRQMISNIRRTAISLRRYIAPQRDVMNHLYNEKVDWLNDQIRMRIREIADRTIRYVEDLDSIRDRTTVTQEELNGRLSEQMNRTMYLLSIVAGIFMPLGLLTGLLGINVGGIPGTDNPWAFTIFCIILLLVAVVQIWIFKLKKWM